MNNYRTNCNNRRIMPGYTQTVQNNCMQRIDSMQDNSCNRDCTDRQISPNCERSSSEVQSCNSNNCGCNDVQSNQNCDCSCNKPQNNQHDCDCSCNKPQNNQHDCDCNDMQNASACRPEPTLCEFPLGMAYVPIQQWRRLYDICAAFRNGTLFQELNLDFLGRRCN